MLWLALHFAELPLAVLYGDGGGDRGRGLCVLCANAPARTFGVAAGMRFDAALTRAPALLARRYDVAAEQAALRRLATLALRYSDTVCIDAPRGLLIEVGASLRLFGGLQPLLQRLRADLDALDHHAAAAVAPTAAAARLLSRYRPRVVSDVAELTTTLATLPAAALELERRAERALTALGVDRIGELLALPRAGLRRRCGAALVATLERLLGERPDPRRRFVAPPRFDARIELPDPVVTTEPLLFVLRRLLRELAAGLRARDQVVDAYRLRLFDDDGGATALTVTLARPGRDADHWLLLLRERLARQPLAAPVTALRLSATPRRAPAAASAALFDDLDDLADLNDEPAFWRVLERLQSRLGERSVHALDCRADHRPERAWTRRAPGDASRRDGAPARAPRPLWLRERPLALPSGPPPAWRLRGPERIEAGWWDGADVSRDYYRAATPDGRELWLYRERRGARGWFIHGHFA